MINTAYTPDVYVGNGSTTEFEYGFKITAASELVATLYEIATGDETVLILDTDYSVTGVGEDAGGDVTYPISGSPMASTHKLILERSTPETQATDFLEQGGFHASTHETAFDKLTAIIQEKSEATSRAPKFSVGSGLVDKMFPTPSADKIIGWNAAGDELENKSQTVTETAYPGTFTAGVDANKDGSPTAKDIYLATDTEILYICFASATWTAFKLNLYGTDASKPASPKAGQLYIATDTNRVYLCLSAGTWTSLQAFGGILLDEQGSSISTAANQMGLYPKVVDGQSELHYREESDGDEIQVTSDGRLVNFRRIRNFIINGLFAIWQRGTTFTPTADAYGADRWEWAHNADSGSIANAAYSRQAFTAGQTDVPNNPDYFCRVGGQISGGSGSEYVIFQHKIENVANLSGQKVTISFYAKASSARNVGVQVVQNFGSGGSSSVYTSGETKSLTTSWQKFTVTITVPSISGKTVGTSSFLSLAFVLHAAQSAVFDAVTASAETVDLALVQLEKGAVASDFQLRSFAEELAACQRYFFKTFDYATAPVQNLGSVTGALGYRVTVAGTGNYVAMLSYPVLLRTTPTITYYNPGAANAKWRNYDDPADSGDAVTTSNGQRGIAVNNAQVTGDGLGEGIFVHLTADAEL